MDLKNYIIDVNDFPQKGIIFRDITPLIASGEVHAVTIKAMTKEEWRKASLFGA